MKFYFHVSDCVDYDIEAETEEQAQEMALEWWAERMPHMDISEDA